MRNANLIRTQRQTFYTLTRRYGAPATLYRIESAVVNFDTGVPDVNRESVFIRQCLQAVDEHMRKIIYTAAMMQSIRPAAWQGAGQDESHTVFLIYGPDTEDWGDITSDQWVRADGMSYQISDALHTDGGWILRAKLADGSGPTENDDDF